MSDNSVIFLQGNLTEGFQAHGPFTDYDEASAAHDLNEGWMMALKEPGRPVRIYCADGEDIRHYVGSIYLPPTVPADNIQGWIASKYRDFLADCPEPDTDDEFIEWLGDKYHVLSCPESAAVTI